jgi:hypothetical protein
MNFVLLCVVIYGFMKLTYKLNRVCSKLYSSGTFKPKKSSFLFLMLD